jgi:hypothetical protein
MSLEVQSSQIAPSIAYVGLEGARTPTSIAGVSTSLLPEPGAGGLSGTQDALSMMYDLVAKQGEITLALGQISVSNAAREQATQLDQERQAELSQQQAEASQSGGFWHDILSILPDIGKILGVVAAAAATVCSFGTAGVAAVAVAAVLISTGFAVSETHCLGKDSAIFGMGMEVVGSLVTLGAASTAVASTAASSVAQAVATTAKAVSVSAQVAGGVCDVASGVAGIEEGKFESESEDASADVQQALNEINQQSRMVSEIIDGLKSAQESNKNALQIVAGAAHTFGQTSAIAASGGKA